jgi:hypothetical protein
VVTDCTSIYFGHKVRKIETGQTKNVRAIAIFCFKLSPRHKCSSLQICNEKANLCCSPDSNFDKNCLQTVKSILILLKSTIICFRMLYRILIVLFTPSASVCGGGAPPPPPPTPTDREADD